ncbi:amino acid--tRNA ligase-related protein [Candidatus Vidania fulgoroideorum]
MNIKNLKLNRIVTIYGWVESIRNLGKIIFVSLRNNNSIIQIIIENKKINFKKNYCLKVKGILVKKNNIVELICKKISILNSSKIINNKKMSEKKKSINRLFFLKKMTTKDFFIKKSLLLHKIRSFLIKKDFIEIETPVLTNKTKEGAKLFKINKYIYLSQSPQIFKQILMISEYEKYFQFAKCFRNENLRNDRQPEFTQLDIEVSFISIRKIYNISLKIIKIFLKFYSIKKYKIKNLKYKTCINRYGTEKPDLRIQLCWKKIGKKTYFLNIGFKIKKKVKLNINKVFFYLGKKKKKSYLVIIFKKKIYPIILEYILKKICYSKEGIINNLFIKKIYIIFIYEIPMFKKKKKVFSSPLYLI